MSGSNISTYSIKSPLEILENQPHSTVENCSYISFSEYPLIFREDIFTQEWEKCYFSLSLLYSN